MQQKSKYKDDPRYICNPLTGRYVLRTGPTGKKIINRTSKKKQCNPHSPKARDPHYECNPRTGRWNKVRSRKKEKSVVSVHSSPVSVDVREARKKGVRRLIFEMTIIRSGHINNNYIDSHLDYIGDIEDNDYIEKCIGIDIEGIEEEEIKQLIEEEEVKLLNQIKYLIEIEHYIGPLGEDRNNCLHLACVHGHLDIVKLLLNYSYFSEIMYSDVGNINEETPLHCAIISNNNSDLVKYLIDYGFDVDAQSGYVSCTPLHYASSMNNIEIIKHLIKGGADINIPTLDNQNLLHVAAQFCRDIEIMKYLISLGIDVNAQDQRGKTPLYSLYSLRFDDKNIADAIDLLITHGADPYIQDIDGNTALHRYAENGMYEAIKQLIVHNKVNPNIIPNNNGETPFQLIQREVERGLYTSQEIDSIMSKEDDYQRIVQLSRAVQNTNNHLPPGIYRKIDEYLFKRRHK